MSLKSSFNLQSRAQQSQCLLPGKRRGLNDAMAPQCHLPGLVTPVAMERPEVGHQIEGLSLDHSPRSQLIRIALIHPIYRVQGFGTPLPCPSIRTLPVDSVTPLSSRPLRRSISVLSQINYSFRYRLIPAHLSVSQPLLP